MIKHNGLLNPTWWGGGRSLQRRIQNWGLAPPGSSQWARRTRSTNLRAARRTNIAALAMTTPAWLMPVTVAS